MAREKEYNSGSLDAQHQQLVSMENNLLQTGDQIRAQLVSLEGSWQGDASAAFMQAANTWQQGFNQVMEGFNLLNRNVGVANSEFASSESQRASGNTNSWAI